jgi:hypothetical protein
VAYESADGFEELLTKAREDLRALAATAEEMKDRSGSGSAANGGVKVTAVNGRITDVQLDARATRLPPRELAAAFAAAYPGPELPPIDLTALEEQLAQVQLQGTRQMRAYLENITDALRHVT